MEPFTELPYIASFSVLVLWVSIEFIRTWGNGSEEMELGQGAERRSSAVYTALILLCNLSVFSSYLGSSILQLVWKHKLVSLELLLLAASWAVVSIFAIYWRWKTSRGSSRWPLVLKLWWALYGLHNTVSVSVYLTTHLTETALPDFLPSATPADLASFPFSTLLCINSLCMRCSSPKKLAEVEDPLIPKEAGDSPLGEFESAGAWSKLTFRWLNPVFEEGRAKKLELDHIPQVPETETADRSYSLLHECRKRKGSSLTLSRAIIYTVWRPLVVNAVFAAVNTFSSYLGPFLINGFVEFLSGKRSHSSSNFGYTLAFLLFFSKTVESLCQRQWYFGARRIGIRVRAALMVSIYNKSLSVKYSSAGVGKTINLLDVDVERIGDFCWYFHSVWLLPIQIFLALLILYRNLGAAASFAAFLATMLVMVSNIPLAGMQEMMHSRIMEAKDSRMRATAETLKCMRILKLQAWENAYLKRILQLRDVERRWIKRYLYTCSAIAFLFWASPTLVSVVTFGVCIIAGTPLTPGNVLSALATFRILQEPIYNLPELVAMVAQTKVSIDRIEDFIKEEDQKPRLSHRTEGSDVAVEVEVGEYAWDADAINSRRPTIKIDRRIKIMRGEKVAICGSVGSGKSSFLYSIIEEIPRTSGAAIKVSGKKAYVPQSAWIQTGTVRENILFGKDMERQYYEEVIRGCALDRDVEMWAYGDQTMVGERGINLSGGQKQRIQLARAVYSDSDVYLLDDPFSAVDAQTGAHLFKECLMTLLSRKTVIYVTHQLEFLDASDLVLVIRDGRIVQAGKYEDLIADSDGELVRQVAAHKKSLSQVPTTEEHVMKLNPKPTKENELQEEKPSNIHDKRTNQEETEAGRVGWNVYSTFVTSAYRGLLIPAILLCQVLFQGLQIGSNYWIAWAVERSEQVSRETLLEVFVLMSIGSSVFVLGRAVLLATVSIETAQRLFFGMITRIFQAPISFFDTTPSSRILNRSSTDQSIVDTDIPYRLAGSAFALLQLLGIIILMSQITCIIFILFLIVLIISYWYQVIKLTSSQQVFLPSSSCSLVVQGRGWLNRVLYWCNTAISRYAWVFTRPKHGRHVAPGPGPAPPPAIASYYISTARELGRMLGIRKAPILHHFAESTSGAATIRCFNQEDRFLVKNHTLVDDYSRITFHNAATMEWLSVRINFLFNFIFFLMLAILVTLPRDAIDPSLAGLAATYGLTLNILQAWVIWNLCNVENKMISVERILQYSKIPTEAPAIIENCRPEPRWPANGTIEFHNLHVRYSPGLPLVLRGISCMFPGERKVGVVGRTGSGKSTLIQALFRVVEPSQGRITIDGLDISHIGLHDLRSRLSIIPQDPSLFQGTVRTNLDPLQQHSDADIWEALHKCHLGEIVERDPRRLDAPVAEDGENWSVGQRQLVCLARALLKKRRILVLDEATASVDTGTDNVIQKTIREETCNCTVITVAHRIPTVIDNDLVLVLDEGRIMEYSSPSELLSDKASAFSKLVMEFLRRSKTNYH
ncbi:hypothetical protein Taro_009652 [Colocasia esculenta]|uniref:ABC transporter C family member 3 n=1 Tax=Colocasia esculenta TaxID=4460 RepID=A0A843U4M0_COLES|nr:hypothetical protein [Colocasia esculenta]